MSKKPPKYAAGTEVTIERSQLEIRDLLKKHGATSFGTLETPHGAGLACELKSRRLRFEIQRPVDRFKRPDDQEYRRLWRVLLITIKARLEEVNNGSPVDSAFMSFICLPNGQTVSQMIVPAIEKAYSTGEMPPLLLEYRQ